MLSKLTNTSTDLNLRGKLATRFSDKREIHNEVSLPRVKSNLSVRTVVIDPKSHRNTLRQVDFKIGDIN